MTDELEIPTEPRPAWHIALDEINEACGFKDWEYPGQITRAVRELVAQRDRWEAEAMRHLNDYKLALIDKGREERACLEVMEERDRCHEWADNLTDAIAQHFGQDFGEHSSANNPWANALEYLENAD